MQRAGVVVDGVQRLAHLMMRAELDDVICSGARRGRQFTYALLDAPLVVGGRVAGGWRSTLEKNRVVVRLAPQAPEAYVSAIGKAARAYADFLEIDVALA